MLDFARLLVHASWTVLIAYFILGWARARRDRVETGRESAPASLAGMAMEAASFLLVVFFRVEDPGLPLWVYGLASGLAMASSAFGIMAGIHLGQQLRLQAVVTDEHRLIRSGPYSVLRHPIYASMLGLLVSVALVFADWHVLIASVPVFLLGTEVRVRAEDRLLAKHFGERFSAYRSQVKAYLPGIR